MLKEMLADPFVVVVLMFAAVALGAYLEYKFPTRQRQGNTLNDIPGHRLRAEHARRHRELHAALDELFADWIMHGGGGKPDAQGRLVTQRPILDLIEWSYKQTQDGPDHADGVPKATTSSED